MKGGGADKPRATTDSICALRAPAHPLPRCSGPGPGPSSAAAPAPTARPVPLSRRQGRGLLGLSAPLLVLGSFLVLGGFVCLFWKSRFGKHRFGEAGKSPGSHHGFPGGREKRGDIPGGAGSTAARLPSFSAGPAGCWGSHPAPPAPDPGWGVLRRHEEGGEGGLRARKTACFISKWDRSCSWTRRSQI